MSHFERERVKGDHWSPAACWRRRMSLCLGYRIKYDRAMEDRIVSIYSIQNGRSDALLGQLRLKADEWKFFFDSVYGRWEDLSEPHGEAQEDQC